MPTEATEAISSILNFIMGLIVGALWLGRYFHRNDRHCGECLNCRQAEKHMPCEKMEPRRDA